MSLHDRIMNLPSSRSNVKDQILAIKWLGNHGTHAAIMTRSAVYDAIDIFEMVLSILYSDHPARMKKRVSGVNKRGGPMRVTRHKLRP